MSQYAGICFALSGHDICPVLAHSHAVPVTGDREAKDPIGIGKRKGRGSKAEKPPQLRALHADAAKDGASHSAALVKADLPDPGALIAGKIRLRVGLEQGIPEIQRRTLHKTYIVRHIFGSLRA